MQRVKRGITLSVFILTVLSLQIIASPTPKTSAESSEARINVGQTVKIEMTENFTMPITPDGLTHANGNAAKVLVSSNADNGYFFFTKTSSLELVDQQDPENTIKRHKGDINSADPSIDLEMNSWGINVMSPNGGTGVTITTDSYVLVDNVTRKYEPRTYTLTVAAKIDDTVAPGKYGTTIGFYAIPNIAVDTIANAVYFHDMSNTVAASMEEGVNYTLKDIRDDKEYYVSKHAGVVSMVQNLDYTPYSYYENNIAESQASVDPNKFVYQSGNNIYRNDDGTEYTNNEAPSSAEEANNKAGGYYSYAAATGGAKDLTTYTGYINNSICPTKWRIPTYNEAANFNMSDTGLTWSNNNGYVGLANILKLNSGQVYWTVDVDKSNKQVRAYTPASNMPFFTDARNLASIRCKYNQNFTYKLRIEWPDTPQTITRNTTSESITEMISVGSRADAVNLAGFTDDPTSTVPNYAVSTIGYNIYLRTTIDREDITLYPIYFNACNSAALTIEDAVCLQDMNSAIRKSMVVNQQYQLIDKRDNQPYWIVRLENDEVWMSQNLSYYSDYKIEWKGLTNIRSNSSSHHYSTANYIYTISDAIVGETKMSLDEGYYMKNGTEKTSISSQQSNEESHYNLGKYYLVSENLNICPKGWKVGDVASVAEDLGIISSQNYSTNNPEYVSDDVVLDSSITKSNLLGAPLYLEAGGYKIETISREQGYKGKYINSQGGVFAFTLDDDSVTVLPRQPYNSWEVNQYYQVRCMTAAKGIDDVTYMQDVTPDIIEATIDGTELQLTDKRDGKKYWVKKFENGPLQMEQDLAFYIPTTGIQLDGETSNKSVRIASLSDLSRREEYSIINLDYSDYYYNDSTRANEIRNDVPENSPERKNNLGVYYTASAVVLGDINVLRSGTSNSWSNSICPKGWDTPMVKYTSRTVTYDTSSKAFKSTNLTGRLMPNYYYGFDANPRFGYVRILSGVASFNSVGSYNDNPLWYSQMSVTATSGDLRPLRCIAITAY